MRDLQHGRVIIRVLTALAVAALAFTGSPAAEGEDVPVETAPETATDARQDCGFPCACPGQQGARSQGRGREARMGRGPGGPHHDNIHTLLDRHASIERHVEDIDGGVETITTSTDADTVATIRQHVRQMQDRLASGHGMRHWDPLFVELFRRHDDIRMEILDVPGGVRVRETSDDPQVALLIREHARAVNGFVSDGCERAHRATPLPEGYASAGNPARAGRKGCRWM